MVNQEPNLPSYYERLRDAIQATANNGEFVTNWITIVEVLDADGDKGIFAFHDEGSTPWHTMGMLDYVIQKLRGEVDMTTWASRQMQLDELDEKDDDSDHDE